jgi:hypothetical protein
MDTKYDVLIGLKWDFRVMQGASKAAVDEYCARKGFVIATDRAIGLSYREVTLVKKVH